MTGHLRRWMIPFFALAACQGAADRAPSADEATRFRATASLRAAAPTLSERAPLTPPVFGSQEIGGQQQVHLAWGAGEWFACWINQSDLGVRGARVAADGTVLDVPSVALFPGYPQDCDVAWDGAQFVVSSSVDVPDQLDYTVELQRVAPDGSLDGAALTLGAPVAYGGSSSLPFTKLGCANGLCEVVWFETVPPPGSGYYTQNLRAQLVDTALWQPVGDAHLFSTEANGYSEAALSPIAQPGGFTLALMTSSGSGSLPVQLFDATLDGGLSAGPTICTLGAYGAGDGYGFAARPDGGGYFAFNLNEYSSGSTYSLGGSRFDGSGNATDGCGHILDEPAYSASVLDLTPQAAWTGSDWMVDWVHDSGGVFVLEAAHVSDSTGAMGAQLPLVSLSTGTDGLMFRSSCGEPGCLFGWADARGAESSQYVAHAVRLLADGGTPDDGGVLLALAGNGQRRPALAPDGRGWFAVWADHRGANFQIYGARLNPDGSLAGPEQRISALPLDEDYPAVACADGGTCVVAWNTENVASNSSRTEVRVARVLADGGLLDPDGGVAIAENAYASSYGPTGVASAQGGFLVVYTDSSATKSARLVDADAGVAAASFQVGPFAQDMSLTASARDYLLAWAEVDVYARRFATDGGALDSSPVTIATASYNGTVRASSDGDRFFVSTETDSRGIQGYLLPDDGGAPAQLGQTFDAGWRPASAARVDGGWLQVWNGPEAAGSSAFYGMAVVGDDGGLLYQHAAVTEQVQYSNSSELAAATSPAGSALLLYDAPDLDAGNLRMFRRGWSSGLEQGAGCAQDSDCASQHCSDGVCCDSACGGGDPGDCQACSVDAGAAVDGTCAPISAGLAHVCRASAGDCDPAELCDGAGTACPPDQLAPSTQVCRPAAGQCDAPELCTGSSPDCPADAPVEVGTPCSGSNLCYQQYGCEGFTCAGLEPVRCDASDACHVPGTCDPSSGRCSTPAAPDGTLCDDHDACTAESACQGGVCKGSGATSCAPPGACQQAGVCDPSSGDCSYAPAADGTSCDDGNPCTVQDACSGGACHGATRSCPASDECHVAGVCAPSSGACSNPPAADGTSCSSGTCQAGVCTAPASSGGCESSGAGSGLAALLALGLLAAARGRRPAVG